MPSESSNWSSLYGPLVQDKIWHQAEGPALDKKREHYYLDEGMTDASGNPVDHLKKRAEFLKDVIALANTARRQRSDTYICLGIAEYDDWTIWGVEGKHPKRNPQPAWTDVEAHPDLMNKWVEGIQRAYVDFAREYIQPVLPDIHYETGWIDSHLVGLLVIKPLSSPKGFYLTEDGQKGHKLQKLGLEPGCSWRRLGALTEKIEPHQREMMLKSYNDYPYIPLEGWRTYLRELSTRYEYRPEDPNQPNLYQPLQGWYGSHKIENVTEFLDHFAHSPDLPNVLLVIGPPGCGKTTLLERLTRDLALEASQAIESTYGGPYVPGQPRALDYPKDAPVPVLVKLWGFEYSRQNTPERLFCRAMTDQAGDKIGIDQHASPAKILEDRDLKFVVMLDGLDEIPRRQRLRTVKALAGFVQDHPHARFIITCRSDLLQDMGPEWGAYSQLRIESMTPVQARQYLGGTVWESLLDRDDILTSTLQLLCNPRRINALREAERPVQSLGGVLEKAIEGFLAEEHKKYESDQRTRSRVESKTDLFAFCLLEQGLQEVGEETAREILKSSFDWLYRAGLLVLRDGCCGFTEPIVRDYFAARRLLNLYRNRKLAPVVQEIAAHPDQWFGAIAIAVNIWRDDITAEPMASLLVILQPGHRLQAVAERRFSST